MKPVVGKITLSFLLAVSAVWLAGGVQESAVTVVSAISSSPSEDLISKAEIVIWLALGWSGILAAIQLFVGARNFDFDD